MRFMILVKANKDSEAGILPDEKILTEMGKFNIELEKAGVMLAGEGLQASSKGARVRFSGGKRTVIDGPFAEAKELIAGFWLWQVKSREEAIEWVKRCPNPLEGEAEIEIRQVYEADDFGAALTPELREAEERLRGQPPEEGPHRALGDLGASPTRPVGRLLPRRARVPPVEHTAEYRPLPRAASTAGRTRAERGRGADVARSPRRTPGGDAVPGRR